MKNYNIRTVDGLGRVVIPIDLRNKLAIEERDEIEFFEMADGIYLKKRIINKECVLCRTTENVNHEVNGYHLCQSCIEKVKNIK